MIPEIQKILRKNFKPGDDTVYITVKVDGKEFCRIYEDRKKAEFLTGIDNDLSDFSIAKELRMYLEDQGYSVTFPSTR